MKLADVVDLEARLAADEGVDAEVLRARDHAAFGRIPVPAADRHGLLCQWLRAVRAADEPSLGERVVKGFRLLKLLLLILGFAIGWSTAALLLHYDGSEPINVATFLLVIVGLQLCMLTLLFVVVPLLQRFPGLPLFGDLHNLLRVMARGLEKLIARTDDRLSPERREAWRAARARLQTRASLYPGVEQWLLLDAAQVFAVAFNVAVLLCCVRLVVFSDLAFAWSTTLKIDAEQFHHLTTTLSAPFRWLVPDAVPTRELVDATRFWRGDFHDGIVVEQPLIDVKLAGDWWPFLIACTVTYGLLPRLLVLLSARLLIRRSLARLPLDTPDIERILRRLRAPVVDTRATSVAVFDPERAGEVLPSQADVASAEPLVTILWRDLPADEAVVGKVVAGVLGASVLAIEKAGGFDYDRDRSTIAGLAARRGRLLLLAEGFEAPDKSVRRFLADLRAAVGPRRTILVGLVEIEGDGLRPSPQQDIDLWRDRLQLLNDPYLAVESMEVS